MMRVRCPSLADAPISVPRRKKMLAGIERAGIGSRSFVVVVVGVALLACGSCAGFASLGQQFEEQAEKFESGSDFPPEAKGLSTASLEAVIDAALHHDIWSQFELARRYEQGAGIERDVPCAAFWYDYAHKEKYSALLVAGTYRTAQQRSGHPLARAALRRLGADPDTAPAVEMLTRNLSELLDRCYGTIRDASFERRFGSQASAPANRE